MSTISQTIPNLLLGISQQPDNRKRPGQVKDAVNAFPDFALGMLKRPGGKFVSKLHGGTSGGKWFPILRSGTEKYIGQYNPTTFDFKVWNLSDGSETIVDMGANFGQPATCPITGAGPIYSTNVNFTPALVAGAATNLFDGNVATFAVGIVDTNLLIQITAVVRPSYSKLEVFVDANTASVTYNGNTIDNELGGANTPGAGWITIDENPNTLNDIGLIPVAGQAPAISAIRVNGAHILFDTNTAWNVTDATTALNAAQTALNGTESALQEAGKNLAKCIAGQVSTVKKLFATDFRQLSNPRAQDYANSLKEFLRSGIIENEETARQATATVSVTNTITDVGVSAGGSGYTSAPTVTIAGSGSNATAVANISDTGVFKSVDLLTAGSNYDERPLVSVGAGFAGYNATALLNNAGQVASVDLDGKVKITSTDVFYDFNQNTGNLGGADDRDSGTGLGNQGDFKLGENYIHFGRLQVNCGFAGCSTSDGFPRAVNTSNKTDLTDCSSVRIYAIAGNYTNGAAKPETSSTDLSSGGNLKMRRLVLKFLSQDTEPTRTQWDAQTEMFLVVDSEYSNLNVSTNPISPDVFCVGDATSGTISNNIAASGTDKLHAVNIAIPAQYKKANTWMRLEQKFNDSVQTGPVAQDVFGVLSINPIPTTRTGTDAPLTFTTNPIDSGTPVAATATALTNKVVESLTLTNAGSGYNVGQATTISLAGGNPTVAATPTITLTPTFTGTITEAGLGYVNPTATLSGGGGADATVAVTAFRSKVTGFTFTGGNSDYTSNPTITISAPDLKGAQFARTLIKKDGDVLDGAANFVSIKQMGQNLTAVSGTNIATTTNGKGTGITVDLTVAGGQITEATINTNGTGYYTGDELYPAGYTDVVLRVGGIAKGTERTHEHPVLASTGFRIYEAEETLVPAFGDNDLNHPTTGKLTLYNTAKINNDNALNTRDIAQDLLDSVKSHCKITAQPADCYLNGATADDIEVLTVNDYTFVVNKNKDVAMVANDLTNPNVTPNRGCVVIQVAANSVLYQVVATKKFTKADTTVVDVTGVANTNAPTSAANAATIAENLRAAIAAMTFVNPDTGLNTAFGFTALRSGPSILLSHPEEFRISAGGGVSSESLICFTDTISNVSLLPAECQNGYVVKVTNSIDINIDDMYVEFTASNDAGYGVGTWTETTEPGITYKFDPKTMPHALVNTAAGKFELQEIDWNKRIVGDEETNPKPSFVGNKISNVFFYRGRMGILSGQNVILSQAGDIFNFWNQTAKTSVASDPIDISAAGKKPVFLNYVQPTSVGLVLYSSNEQFILTTDADVLSPTSTKINQLSSYECDDNIEAVGLGTSQALVTKTPLFTRVFELSEISADQQPVMQDITNVVPELIPESINSMVASPALSIVSLGEQGKPDIFQYRFLNRGRDERELNSWYRWKLTGNLEGQFFESSTWYAIVSNNNNIYVQSFDMTQSNEQGFLTLPTGEKTDVCLDLFDVNPYRLYEVVANSDKTRFFLPFDSVAGTDLNVIVLGGYIGEQITDANDSVGAVYKPTIVTSGGDTFVEIDGDLRGRDVIIGYNYNMEIDLPRIYKYKVEGGNVSNDDVSSLILHRLKFKTGLSGPVDYKVSITGREDWDNAVSVTQPNQYELNNVNMQAKATHVVPVFQRNENLAVKIIGNTPFPVSLLGLDWEGKFNQRFYRRG